MTFNHSESRGLVGSRHVVGWFQWGRSARRALRRVFLAVLLPALGGFMEAAVYHVTLGGNDNNTGEDAQPWRSIQKAADTLLPGDTVVVGAGVYDERVVTVRGGTSDAERITFRADGVATMLGFSVGHPYITLDGFDVTGHSSSDDYESHLEVSSNGDYAQLLNNTVRDGIHLVRADMVFSDNDPNPDTITTATGGVMGAGFKAGQTIWIGRGTNSAPLLNGGEFAILEVADNTLTVVGSLEQEGPVHAYVTASHVYGLVVGDAEGCVVRSNVFRNLTFDAWFVGGASNVFEGNTITETHGWDVMHFMGADHVFRGNFIHSCPLVVYQTSPDVFENWPTVPYQRVLFESNFVQGFRGVLASQKGSLGNMDTLAFRNNVFVDVGRFIGRNPNISFENNTFLFASATSSPVNSVAPHPLKFEDFNVENAVIRNNIFVGCGEGRNLDVLGWYEFAVLPPSAVLSHNFASGRDPEYRSKVGFDEGEPLLNGGDPGFVNLGDPLGPDGIPFTDDDGLRLRADSKLLGAGEGGVDLGAYNSATPLPALTASLQAGGMLRLAWPVSAEGFKLQAAPAITGSWNDVQDQPSQEGNLNVLTLDASGGSQFYRLSR